MGFAHRTKTIYRRADALTGGVLAIFVDAIQSFRAAHGSQAAASIAYYALFSLFPLLLVLIALASALLANEQAQQQALDSALQWLPVSQDLIRNNIDQLLRARGTVGLIGTLGLVWSATTVFTSLARNISLAWPGVKTRNLLVMRLIGLAIMASGMIVLLILSLISKTVFSTLERLEIPLLGTVQTYDTFLWNLIAPLIPLFFIFVMFLLMYTWVPPVEVKRIPAFWGALVATLLWELVISGFTRYLSSDLARFNVVYGSLGALVALMLWIYMVSWIALFGAHLSAAVAITRHQRTPVAPIDKPAATD